MAEAVRRKAALIDAIDHPVPRTWSAATLSDRPRIREQVFDRIRQIRDRNNRCA